MEVGFKHQLGLVCVILFLPALCSSTNSFTSSRATYYSTADGYGTPSGACGFGEYGRTVNKGSVAGVSNLWNGGSGCGACYQIRCKISKYCDNYGAYVVVTDYGQGDRTDFIMSPHAFSSLGLNAKATAELIKYGTLDVEYRRVPCIYSGSNILFKVLESSQNPGYFAVELLKVGGMYDITAIELWQKNRWSPLHRSYGAVFDFPNPPSGKLILRFQVSGSTGFEWKQANPIPSDWKAGMAYDTGIQLY